MALRLQLIFSLFSVQHRHSHLQRMSYSRRVQLSLSETFDGALNLRWSGLRTLLETLRGLLATLSAAASLLACMDSPTNHPISRNRCTYKRVRV